MARLLAATVRAGSFSRAKVYAARAAGRSPRLNAALPSSFAASAGLSSLTCRAHTGIWTRAIASLVDGGARAQRMLSLSFLNWRVADITTRLLLMSTIVRLITRDSIGYSISLSSG